MSVVREQLVNYIVERLQEGYDVPTIRTHLVQFGYDAHNVDAAVNYIYKRRALGQSKFSTARKNLLAMTAAMAVLVIGATFFF